MITIYTVLRSNTYVHHPLYEIQQYPTTTTTRPLHSHASPVLTYVHTYLHTYIRIYSMITRTAWHTFNIGKFSPSELPQLALQLEACEGTGHLPEPDVPSARGGQLALHLGGEGHTVDVLRKGFGPQDNRLLPPFPHSQHVVRAAPHRCKEIAVVGLEVHVAVGLLCSLSQQAVELEVGVAVDGDAGLGPLLSHSKVLVAWVDLGRGEERRRGGKEEGRRRRVEERRGKGDKIHAHTRT